MTVMTLLAHSAAFEAGSILHLKHVSDVRALALASIVHSFSFELPLENLL